MYWVPHPACWKIQNMCHGKSFGVLSSAATTNLTNNFYFKILFLSMLMPMFNLMQSFLWMFMSVEKYNPYTWPQQKCTGRIYQIGVTNLIICSSFCRYVFTNSWSIKGKYIAQRKIQWNSLWLSFLRSIPSQVPRATLLCRQPSELGNLTSQYPSLWHWWCIMVV